MPRIPAANRQFPLSLLAAACAGCVMASGTSSHAGPTPPPAEAADVRPVTSARVDASFFALLDLTTPGLERTRTLVQEKKYAEALEAWRDYSVTKLRGLEAGSVFLHDYMPHPRQAGLADKLLGRPAKDSDPFTDVYDISGPPGTKRAINWVAPGGSDYGSFALLNPVVASYERTRDPAYLEKWFEIAGAFARDQKRAVEQLEPEARKAAPCNWNFRDHGIALCGAWRMHNLVKGVAGLAKALPDGTPPRPWAEALRPTTVAAPPESLRLVPAGALADLAISLLYDHPPFLFAAYEKPGYTPNQRFSGLTGLALAAGFFGEFNTARPLAEKAGACLINYVQTTVLPDGGDLEQAFNYNGNFLREGREMVSLFPDNPQRPEWVRRLHTAILNRERLFAGMAIPLGGLPKNGTNAYLASPAVWTDAKLRENWRARLFAEQKEVTEPVARQVYDQLFGPRQGAAPSFTSVAFPFSGYYALRDGWDQESLYLSFLAPRLGRGHKKENINGIAVTAFGRHLIVDGGPPPYGPDHLTESQRPDYLPIVAYFGEESSLTSNTVIVDGQSQRRSRLPAAATAPTQPIAARWHSSADFDLAEGRYDDGYGTGPKGNTPAAGAKHQRQVLFVRAHGFWIVTDRLQGDGQTHEYQQLWHFPPPHKQWDTKAPGFTEAQVAIDETTRQLRTEDPAGPNIVLRHFTAEPIAYARYFGQKDPYRGWYAAAIGGERLPAVEVAACWRSASDTIVTTVLFPTRNQQDAVRRALNLSRPDGTVAGFNFVLESGTEITYLAARKPAILHASDLNLTGEGLLSVTSPAGEVKGIALGSADFAVAGKKATAVPADFEFAVEKGVLRVVSAIDYPPVQDEVSIRPAGGMFVQPIAVTLTCPGRPGGELRYSTNGAEPTADAALYTAPVTVKRTGDLAVRPFRKGQPSGPIVRARYEIRALPPQPPTPTLFLSDLKPEKVTVGAWEFGVDACCYEKRPLRLGGRTFARGISTHAEAEVIYALQPTHRRFVATVGLDDATGDNGCVIFRVYADDRLLAESPVLEGAAQRFWHLDCQIPTGSRQLRLLVVPGPKGYGWGMGDWVNAGFR